VNKFEELKAARDGLDAWPDVLRCARDGWEAISEEDKTRMKWYGLFFRKHTPGFFMLRVRIPNGIVSSTQLRALAEVAGTFGRGELDITTRQQIQIRWFRIEDVPAIFDHLAAVGLDSRQTGMDNVRNVIGCPLAGLTPHELFDASPVVRRLTGQLVGNRAFSNLPRKFNVTITGCPDNCVHLDSQDIALVPAEDGQGRKGFNVLVGGKMGSGGFTPAQPLDVFVEPEEAANLCCRIIEIFRDHGPREARSAARMAFLLEDWGAERLRAELDARWGEPLSGAGRDERRMRSCDHLGVEPQHQQGMYSVGLAVPVGRLQAAQALELAALADEFGQGELRLTTNQNVILTHVSDRQLPELLMHPLLRTLRPDPSVPLRGTVACTGLGLCDLAMTDTKNDALMAIRRLEETAIQRRPLAISWSGCPAGCGNHHLADIGLQGAKARVDGRVVEVYQVFVGGRAGRAARAGRQALSAIPAAEIGHVVQRLAVAHEAGRDLRECAAEIAAERQAGLAAGGEDLAA